MKVIKSKEDMQELVSLVVENNDQEAISLIYTDTYWDLFHDVKTMIRDEHTVHDILQDSYMKAFEQIGQLQNRQHFYPWLKQIAVNKAKDHLKKKRPMLFSDFQSENEEDVAYEETFVDEKFDHMPEQVLDRKETERLMREIYDALPEDQRVVIGLYYREQLSVKQIAKFLQVSESAVKSRLMYGRRKVKENVLELERKGTKLRGLSPILLLLLLFRSQKAYAAELPVDQALLSNILRDNSMRAGNAGKAGRSAKAENAGKTGRAAKAGNAGETGRAAKAGNAGKTGRAAKAENAGKTGRAANAGNAGKAAKAAKAAGSGAAKLSPSMIAGIAAAAVLTVGVVGMGVSIAKHPSKEEANKKEEVALDTIKMDHEDVEATQPEQVAEAEEPQTESVIPEETEEETDTIDLYDAYNRILDEAESLDFKIVDVGNITGYEYTLVQMDPDDELETLLVSEITEYNTRYIRLFQYVPSTDTLYAPDDGEDILQQEQVMVEIMADGYGLSEGYLGGQGYFSQYRVTFADDHKHLKREEVASFRVGEGGQALETREITDWRPISDRSLLPSGSEMTDSVKSKKETKASALPTDGDRLVLEGTLQTFSYDEVLAWQGQPDPNEATAEKRNQNYYMITFDTILEITLNSVDGMSTRHTDCIYLGDDSTVGAIDFSRMGQDIIFSIDPETTYWPSDTSIPLGRPYVKDIHILN